MSVSAELHDLVLARDGQCFLKRLDDEHQCKDAWGMPHPSNALNKLTVDHVWLVTGGIRGKRAPDKEENLIAMCAESNIRGPSRIVREAQREYLRELYDLS